MPEWLDTPTEWLTILTIGGLILGALSWIIKSQIAMTRDLKPNGGSSLRDQIDGIRDSQQETREDVREIRSQLSAHFRDHMRGQS